MAATATMEARAARVAMGVVLDQVVMARRGKMKLTRKKAVKRAKRRRREKRRAKRRTSTRATRRSSPRRRSSTAIR
jgi:hypothetical protein